MSPPPAPSKTDAEDNIPLGRAVPAHTAHAISVSLPKWKDNVGYEEGEKRVVNSMVSGYPRFFIHLSIVKLARVIEHKYARANESCMLFPSQRVAEHCRSFMSARSVTELPNSPPLNPRLVSLLICPEDKQKTSSPTPSSPKPAQEKAQATIDDTCANLHIVLFPSTAFPIAKQFWQHTGMGISSRLAERCLRMLPDEVIRAAESGGTPSDTSVSGVNAVNASSSPTQPAHLPKFLGRYGNKHYSVGSKGKIASATPSTPPQTRVIPSQVTIQSQASENLDPDHTTYLEERYGRNLPLSFAASAKRALRRRIAGVLVRDPATNVPTGGAIDEPIAGSDSIAVGPSSRGVSGLTEDDVYLYPTGMSAIWNAHLLLREVFPNTAKERKSVCFGFPYTDTLKILEKWGKIVGGEKGGCVFYGNGLDEDLDDLEKLLEEGASQDGASGIPPILAVFTEFPSNPLLRTANLPRLRGLADKYGFLVVVDETIGNFVNVDVLKWADVVVSSLSKVFSGVGNVMGGSLVLNPLSQHYPLLKSHLQKNYEDIYFDEDAIYMERNSRDFIHRIKLIDENAEAVCDFLRSRSLAGNYNGPNTAIKDVFYPKYITRHNYDLCKLAPSATSNGGYGGLFSLTFTSTLASQVFFDALPFSKGPSLGTNFTLACPYTVLAHFGEFEWAGKWGVEEGLVRVSVGCEETEAKGGGEEGREWLVGSVRKALEAAEEAVSKEREEKDNGAAGSKPVAAV